jgi:hypothetical protein
MNFKRLTLIISLLLALLFAYASGLRLWSYANSKVGFDFYPFLKDHHNTLFWLLMVAQIVATGCLILPKARLLGSYSAFFVLASLSTYLYVMLHYADHIPCSCIGIVPGLSWEGHLWFTVIFTILAGVNIVLLPAKDIHAHG